MVGLRALLAAPLAFALARAAGGPEALKAGADLRFLDTAAGWRAALPAAPDEPSCGAPVLQDPKLAPIGSFEPPGALLGSVNLAFQLDRHSDLLAKPLGTTMRLISAAGDAAFKNYFFTFIWADQLVIAPLGALGRLRGEGVDIRIDPETAYNFRVSINIFNPVRGSTFKMTPLPGSRGRYQEVRTGDILDAIEARSFIFRADGRDYWFLAGTDVDPATNRRAATRSYLFVHEDGTDSHAWPVAETALPPGQPMSATLGDLKLVLVREDGRLRIHRAR